MPSPNLRTADGNTRRRKQTKTKIPVATPTTTKASLLSADVAKTPRPPSKHRKPTSTAAAAAATTTIPTATAGQHQQLSSPSRSPRPPPPPGIAPTGSGNARPARRSRTPSAQNSTSTRKTLLEKIREDYDELKRKNNENVKKMGLQEEELKRLKAELLQKTKPEAATNTKNSRNGGVGGGGNQAEMLQAKEKLLQERDEEVRNLRQQLEEQMRIQTSHVDEPVEKEKKEETPLLNELRMENEIAAKKLAEMAKELEELRLLQSPKKGDNDNNNDNAQQLAKLHKEQLEAQRLAHEESLKQYEAALAEKDNLLLELQKKLDQEMNGSQKKLGKNQNKGMAEDPTELVESALEQILEEIEQAEHADPPQIKPIDKVPSLDIRNMKRSQSAQQGMIHQANWSSRFQPTEAVSWPAPQPLSILKKTTGLKKTTAIERITSAANGDHAPVLTPLDPKAVQIYISTVTGNTQIKQKQDQIQQLLRTHHVKFELVDVASSASAFQYMKRANNNGSGEGRPKELPQLFVGGEYRGQYEEVLKRIEAATLDDMLKPAADRHWTPEERAELQKAEAAATTALPQPVRVLPSGPVVLPALRKTSKSSPGPVRLPNSSNDDDEALLQELEREIKSGKVTAIDVYDL